MKRLMLICACALLMQGCGEKKQDTVKEVALIQFEQPQSGDYLATMKTSVGDIKIHLFPKQAPKAVENFVEHAKNGYYNGLKFHRVIQDFMIQGGDPNGNGSGGESIWKKPFEDEFSDQLYNFNGALSMANAGPNTNGSQFFIVQQQDGSSLNDAYFERLKNQTATKVDYSENVIKKYQEIGGTPHLDRMHTVFGQVIEGMDVVNKIAASPTGFNDMPVEDIVIQSIKIEEVK